MLALGNNSDSILKPNALFDSVQSLLLLLQLYRQDQGVAISIRGLNDVRVIKNCLVVDLSVRIKGSLLVIQRRRVSNLLEAGVTHLDYLIKARNIDKKDIAIGRIVTNQFALNSIGLYLLPFRQSKNTFIVDIGIIAEYLEMLNIQLIVISVFIIGKGLIGALAARVRGYQQEINNSNSRLKSVYLQVIRKPSS